MQFIYFLNVQEIGYWLCLWVQAWWKFFIFESDANVQMTPKQGLSGMLERVSQEQSF